MLMVARFFVYFLFDMLGLTTTVITLVFISWWLFAVFLNTSVYSRTCWNCISCNLILHSNNLEFKGNFWSLLASKRHVLPFSVTGWALHLLCRQFSQHYRITFKFGVISISVVGAEQVAFLQDSVDGKLPTRWITGSTRDIETDRS